MTTQQIHLFNCLYLAVLIVVAVLTRATARRIAGAIVGAVIFGVVAMGIIVLGEEIRWWHMAITWKPLFLMLLLIDFALCAFVYLITWRIACRFGWRGLAVVVIVAMVIGPPRDYWYMAGFPEWGALRARGCAGSSDRRDLRHHGGPGSRRVASDRWSRPCVSVGSTAVGDRRTIRCR